MDTTARLARLRLQTQADLDKLPNQPLPAAGTQEKIDRSSSDDDANGGVTLSASYTNIKRPALEPATDEANPPKKSPSTCPESNTERRFMWAKDATSSHNLGSSPSLPPLPPTPVAKLPPATLQKGDLAPAHLRYFTPLLALAKYPYKFCTKNLMQDIASGFFDAGKFWAREWDLFYIWDTEWDTELSKPLALVTEQQFLDLLAEINSSLRLRLTVTDHQREEGLVSRFPEHPLCIPRYLGRSQSREEYDTMISNAPSAGFRAPGEPVPPTLDGRTLEDFKQTMEELWDVQKAKGKAAKEKKKQDRLAKYKGYADQFKRAQRYLGLRPTHQHGLPASGLPPAIDPALAAPFPFDRSVVFVCVDVEAYERAQHRITEIGVATLDTRDLHGVPPGNDGKNWRSYIRARHFRIREHRHLVNTEFVSGCPESFEFGESEWVTLRDAPALIASCFKEPFSAPASETAVSNGKRNLVILGHDTLRDVKNLQQLGFDPLTLPTLLEVQDTATMYRVWRRDQQITTLGKILYDFDIPGFNLHNAGNDAVYTIQAMLGTCVREATIRATPELKTTRENEKATKVAAAKEEAAKIIEDDAAAWSENDADGDGGAPVPIVLKEASKPSRGPVHAHFNQRQRSPGRGGVKGRQPGHQRNNSSGYHRGRGNDHGRNRGGDRVRGGASQYINSGPAPPDSGAEVNFLW